MENKRPLGRPRTKLGPQQALSLQVSVKAKKRLEDMAAIKNISMSAMVESWINQEYQKI